MRGKPGYEHLNEPLHILVEAELPVEIIDARLMQAREILEDLLKPMVTTFIHPKLKHTSFLYFLFQCNYLKFHSFSFLHISMQDESQDYYKKQQLRELALLNGTLRDDGSQMSGSVSPFHNSLGMKRAKTRG